MKGLAVLVIIIVAVVVVFFVARARIPDMLANNLSKKLEVSVSIDSMNFKPSKVEVDKLEIGNPRGYSLPKAFSAQDIDLHAPITTYFRDEIVVDLIEVKDIYLGLEFNSPQGAEGNWSEMMRNFARNADLNEEGEKEKKVFIKRIVFTNIDTDLAFRSQGGQVKKLPRIARIELTNISSEGGIPTDQLMSTVLAQMLKEVFVQQNLNNMIQGILTDPAGAVDTLLKPFKGFFNAAPKSEVEEKRSA